MFSEFTFMLLQIIEHYACSIRNEYLVELFVNTKFTIHNILIKNKKNISNV